MDKQIIIDGIKLHGNRKDLTGLKVGKLTCLKPVKTGKNKHSEWLCECECGNFKIAQTYRLLSGRIQSCGDCYHTINHYIPMIKELEKQLKAKEQECEELKTKLLNLLGKEGLRQSEKEFYEQQLEAYKMEAEEGKEINAELKAENAELKYKAEFFENYNNAHIDKITKLEKTITEIKDYCNKYPQNSIGFKQQILQKISEVEDV